MTGTFIIIYLVSPIYNLYFYSNLYCLSRNDGKLIWNFAVLSISDGKESMVYSSPNYILQNGTTSTNYFIHICVCNTEGDIYILKWILTSSEVEVVKKIKLPKAVFSSPVWINQHQLVVGCRDNNLYSIKF